MSVPQGLNRPGEIAVAPRNAAAYADPDDRRGVLVELTAKGRRTYQKAVGAAAKKEALIAAALTEREKRQLNALLRRLMLEFERRENA